MLSNGQFAPAQRENNSFLAVCERRAIAALVAVMPDWMTPLRLTLLGVVGACMVAIGLIGCNFSSWSLILVYLGLALNWYGDSLDGSLARHRNIQRPRYGFLVDHASDQVSNVIMIAAFGLSPFLSPISALTILSMYLLFSGYTYILVSVERVHHMSYGGMGATEFRILMGAWCAIALFYGPSLLTPLFGVYNCVDLVIASLSLGALVLFANRLITDSRRIADEEGVPQSVQQSTARPFRNKKLAPVIQFPRERVLNSSTKSVGGASAYPTIVVSDNGAASHVANAPTKGAHV